MREWLGVRTSEVASKDDALQASFGAAMSVATVAGVLITTCHDPNGHER